MAARSRFAHCIETCRLSGQNHSSKYQIDRYLAVESPFLALLNLAAKPSVLVDFRKKAVYATYNRPQHHKAIMVR